jgi:hypothetical protein
MWLDTGISAVALSLIPSVGLFFQIASPDEGFESKSLYESWLEKDPSPENKDFPR